MCLIEVQPQIFTFLKKNSLTLNFLLYLISFSVKFQEPLPSKYPPFEQHQKGSN